MSEIDDMDAEVTYGEEDDDHGAAHVAPLATNLGPGVYDIPMTDYLADPAITPSLRSSDIQRILRLTPAHVKAFHPRLVDNDEDRKRAIRKATKRMDLGNVIHALVLRKGSSFCVIDPTEFLTTKGKPAKAPTKEYDEAVAAAQARGLIVLKSKANTIAQRAAERLIAKLSEEFADFGGWPFGEVERTLIWTEQTAHGSVMCRTRPDILSIEHGIEVDVKSSAAGLSDDGINRSLSADGGAMFVQAAWQRRGLIANFPDLAGRATHRHAFIETEFPYLPRIVRASIMKLELADRRCTRAVEAFALARETGMYGAWPEMVGEGQAWLEKEWIEEEEEEITREDS